MSVAMPKISICGIEKGTSIPQEAVCMLGNYSTTELHSSALQDFK